MQQLTSLNIASSLTTDNLNYLNDSLSKHAHHQQRHSQRHRQNKSRAKDVLKETPTSTAIQLESSSSTNSSPELSSTPMSNLSSVSSVDDLSVISQKSDSTPLNHYSSSSSLSTIVPTQQTTPRTMPMGSPLLRKKSGELLKSSLKLPDLQRCASMPNAKSVRFATDLERVKLFEKTERPIAVSTENSPVFDGSFDSRRVPYWDFDTTTSSSESEDEEVLEKAQPWKVISCNVHSSFSLNPAKTVQLMRVNLDNNRLTGSIFVKNLDFSKKVSLRISIDGWKSIVIIQSTYKRSVNSQFDEFCFELNVTSLNYKFYKTSLTIDLCVEFEVGGQIYWDNNNGCNYKVVLEKLRKKKNDKKSNSPPQREYFNNFISKKLKNIDLNDSQDEDLNFRLKPKTSRYDFRFDNKYTFNDSILSQPNINKFDFSTPSTKDSDKTEKRDPFLSTPITTETNPTFLKDQMFKSTPDLWQLHQTTPDASVPISGSTSNLNNEDEYHRLIRNYCYAFS